MSCTYEYWLSFQFSSSLKPSNTIYRVRRRKQIEQELSLYTFIRRPLDSSSFTASARAHSCTKPIFFLYPPPYYFFPSIRPFAPLCQMFIMYLPTVPMASGNARSALQQQSSDALPFNFYSHQKFLLIPMSILSSLTHRSFFLFHNANLQFYLNDRNF